MSQSNEKILYLLTFEDAQNVADELIDRELTKKELKLIQEYYLKDGYPEWRDEMEKIIMKVISK
jgi:hypothetical protein